MHSCARQHQTPCMTGTQGKNTHNRGLATTNNDKNNDKNNANTNNHRPVQQQLQHHQQPAGNEHHTFPIDSEQSRAASVVKDVQTFGQ